MTLVFDANALIAYLEDEPGAELVEDLLNSTDEIKLVHSVNLCEVYYGACREHGEDAAQLTMVELRKAGLTIRDDMDEDFWQHAGRIKADYRRISLADCFCAALAVRLGGEVITADREFEPIAAAGVCSVRFIR